MEPLSLRAVADLESLGLVEGVSIHRDVVQIDRDPGGRKGAVDLALGFPGQVLADADRIQVIARQGRRGLPGQDDGQVRQCHIVSAGDLTADPDELLKAPQLTQSERSLEVGHAVVESEVDLLVVPDFVRGSGSHPVGHAGHPVGAVTDHAFGQVGIIGGRHAPLGGGDDLHRMETEDGDVAVSARSDLGSKV